MIVDEVKGRLRLVERTLAEPNDRGPAGLAQKLSAIDTTVRIEERNSKLATGKSKLKWLDWVELQCAGAHWAKSETCSPKPILSLGSLGLCVCDCSNLQTLKGISCCRLFPWLINMYSVDSRYIMAC